MSPSQSLSKYDIELVDAAITAVYEGVPSDWGWSKEVARTVLGQICRDNVKNLSRRAVSKLAPRGEEQEEVMVPP